MKTDKTKTMAKCKVRRESQQAINTHEKLYPTPVRQPSLTLFTQYAYVQTYVQQNADVLLCTSGTRLTFKTTRRLCETMHQFHWSEIKQIVWNDPLWWQQSLENHNISISWFIPKAFVWNTRSERMKYPEKFGEKGCKLKQLTEIIQRYVSHMFEHARTHTHMWQSANQVKFDGHRGWKISWSSQQGSIWTNVLLRPHFWVGNGLLHVTWANHAALGKFWPVGWKISQHWMKRGILKYSTMKITAENWETM